MAKARGAFTMNRANAAALVRALRACTSWGELPPGDMVASLFHQDSGIEVEVTLYRARPEPLRRPIGFRME